jgi:hypothetical protein
MKKIFILSSLFLSALQGFGQTVVVDTVSTGASYVNQVYYKLSSGAEVSVPANDWDIAFQTGIMSGGIWLNNSVSAAGPNTIKAFVYPNGAANNSDFTEAWDTVGSASWVRLYNPDSTWDWGGFNITGDVSDLFDYGWGNYAGAPTHNVIGDSLYLFIKGSTAKKLWIVAKLSLENKYVIRTADLDGSNDVTDTLSFNPYLSKNLAYYTLGSGQVNDREPATSEWDLLFTRYNGRFSGFANQSVTGVISNPNVSVAKAYPVADVDNFEDVTGLTFSDNISTIGAAWKTPPPPVWVIEDSLVYFASRGAELWKIVFTGFGGSANGNYIFWKKQLAGNATSVAEQGISNATLYPNPSVNENTMLVYTIATASQASYNLFDMTGKLIESKKLNGAAGLHTEQLGTAQLAPGMYIVNLMVGNSNKAFKLVVR